MKPIYLKLLNGLAFSGMVATNALAVLLPINGQNTGEISDMYPSYFTPVGFTFSIWSLIYLWLLVFVIAQWFYADREYYKRLSILFLISCLANMNWIIAWHYLMPFLSLLIMLCLLATLSGVFLLLQRFNLTSWEKVLIQFPFHIYLGWISVATIANVSAWLVSISWHGGPLSDATWTIIMISIAALLSLFMAIRYRAYFYSMVTIWAFYGIWARWIIDDQNQISEVAIAMILILAFTILFFIGRQVLIVQKMKKS